MHLDWRWIVAGLMVVLAAPITGAQTYHLTDLGTLGGSDSFASGINDRGEVVGNSQITGDANHHAFIYQNGTMQDLATLGGGNSVATGINDSGQIVGSAETGVVTSGVKLQHAFLYFNGSMQDLSTLGGGNSYGVAINDTGQVVGDSEYLSGVNGPRDAFLYQNGAMQDLGTLGGNSSEAWDINNGGQIVGNSDYDVGGGSRPFLYQNGSMQNLGTLSDGTSVTAINDYGQVVGGFWNGSYIPHAFLYENGIMQDLGTLGGDDSGAEDVNNSGQVVGYARTLMNQDEHSAFLYQKGTMKDLADLLDASGSGWTFETGGGIAINDAGQIAISARNPQGLWRAVLLTPTPEPSGLAMLAIGALAWMGRRNRAGKRIAER
jgi:probable HAF family extracellular repeat protein